MTAWPRPPVPWQAPEERADLEALDTDACWSRLGDTTVGRVAVATADGTILVLPVNYVLDDGTIVFRTAPGAILDHLAGTVTFQVDAVDPWHHTGWSVLVHGQASVAPVPCDFDDAPMPWAGAHRRHVVTIVPERVTGRAIRVVDGPWDSRGYL